MVNSKCSPLYLQNSNQFPGPCLGKSKKTRSVSLPLSFLGIGVCTAVSVLIPTMSGLVTYSVVIGIFNGKSIVIKNQVCIIRNVHYVNGLSKTHYPSSEFNTYQYIKSNTKIGECNNEQM